jgi:hypothetical protein
MEKNKITLTENQLRSLVYEELITYLSNNKLINENLYNNVIKPSLFAALLFLGAKDITASGKPGEEGEGKTIQQVLDEAGMTDKVLSELEVGLTKEDLKKIKELYVQEKSLEKQLEVAEQNQDSEQAKILKSKINNLFSNALRKNPEQQKRMLKTGKAIHQYLASLPQDAYEQIGDPQEQEALRNIQSKALSYQMKPETQSKNISQATVSDLNNLFKVIKDEGYSLKDDKIDTIISWSVENGYLNKLPQKFDLIDILKIANEEGKIDSELLDPSNFKEKRVEEISDTLPDISHDEAKMKFFGGDTAGLQESKMNKLKIRLNELRGLYV